jgi:hypothetical protein
MKGGFLLSAASVFWLVRYFDASIGVAYGVQALSAAAALATVGIAARRFAGDVPVVASITLCCSLLVSPYLYAADYVGYSIAVALLIERKQSSALPLLLLWVAPGISEMACAAGAPPLLPLFAIFVAMLAWLSAGPSVDAAGQVMSSVARRGGATS